MKISLTGGLALPATLAPPAGGSDFPQYRPEGLYLLGLQRCPEVLCVVPSMLQMGKLRSEDGKRVPQGHTETK